MKLTGTMKFFMLIVMILGVCCCSVALAVDGDGDEVVDGDEVKTDKEIPNWFDLIFIKCGFIGWLILALSVVLVSLSIDDFTKIKREKLIPPGIEAKVSSLVQKKRLDQLVTVVRSTDSYLTRILIKGIAEIQGGYVSMKQAMEEAGEEETIRLNQRISWLALIGNIAPMLGLFGTVFGMLGAFRDLAGMDTTDASLLAKNIYVALATTFLGLAVAMPAIFFYNVFRNRIVLYSLEVSGFCEQFLRLLRRTYGAQLTAAATHAIPPKSSGATPPAAGQPPKIDPLPPVGN